jgi:Protein of unknown function (DUF2568)
MKTAALTLRFLLELAALTALWYAGAVAVGGWLGWLAGLVLAGAAAVAWGLFVAPRARVAAPVVVRLAVEVTVFAAACTGLLLAGRAVLASVLGLVYLLDRVALRLAGAPTFEAPR